MITSTNTPTNFYNSNNGIRLLAPYQIHKELIVNENFMLLDSLLNSGVASCSTMQIPATPGCGDKYIVPDGAALEEQVSPKSQEDDDTQAPQNDCWDPAHTGHIAIYLSGRWLFIQPRAGNLQWVADERRLYLYDGGRWLRLSDVTAERIDGDNNS